MTTQSNRVRTKGSGFATAGQSEIKPPELAILVYDFEKDDNICQQNLSACETAAIERSLKKRGMSWEKFIKKAIHGAVEAAQEIRSAKTQEAGKQPETSATPQPDICREVADAFIELDNAASAAVALAMMNASYIGICISDFAGWEDFNSACFKAGSVVLPRLLAARFEREFGIWDEEKNRMVELFNHPKVPAAGAGAGLCEIENAVNALVSLVNLQGQLISQNHEDYSFACSFVVIKSLKSAFDKAWDSYHKLSDALRSQKAGTIPQAA